jgi:hypothetical protein
MIRLENDLLYLSFGTIIQGELQLVDTVNTEIVLTETGSLEFFERSIRSMKLDRNRGMFFAGFASGTGTAPTNVQWEVLGRDNDDLSKDLNPDTETSKNVLGETTFKHSGYEPEVSVDPYYADSESNLYTKLLAAAVQEKYGDEDIKGYFVEVVFTTVNAEAGTMTGTGYMREAYIVPQSTGGDTSGLGIPFTVNPVGPMTAVTVVYTMATRAVSITTAT